MFEWFWNLQQQSQIDSTRTAVHRAEMSSMQLQRRLEDAEARLDALALYTAAVWELAAPRLNLRREDIEAKVEEIDMRDGVRDNRVTPAARACPQCGHSVNTRHARCIYCGTEVR
jgi:hypothetical protein